MLGALPRIGLLGKEHCLQMNASRQTLVMLAAVMCLLVPGSNGSGLEDDSPARAVATTTIVPTYTWSHYVPSSACTATLSRRASALVVSGRLAFRNLLRGGSTIYSSAVQWTMPITDLLGCYWEKAICYGICDQAADDVAIAHGEAVSDAFYNICIGNCPLCGSEGREEEEEDGDGEGDGT